jgi:C-terminal processing protease CtpA/Prc
MKRSLIMHVTCQWAHVQYSDRLLCSQQGLVAPEPLGWLLLERVMLTASTTAVALPGSRETVGVGIKLEFDRPSRSLLITEVVPNSPASLVHMPIGVLLQKIDDIPTAGKSELQCAGLIRGPVGSKVRLELVDAEQKKTTTIELTREKLNLPIVKK